MTLLLPDQATNTTLRRRRKERENTLPASPFLSSFPSVVHTQYRVDPFPFISRYTISPFSGRDSFNTIGSHSHLKEYDSLKLCDNNAWALKSRQQAFYSRPQLALRPSAIFIAWPCHLTAEGAIRPVYKLSWYVTKPGDVIRMGTLVSFNNGKLETFKTISGGFGRRLCLEWP